MELSFLGAASHGAARQWEHYNCQQPVWPLCGASCKRALQVKGFLEAADDLLSLLILFKLNAFVCLWKK